MSQISASAPRQPERLVAFSSRLYAVLLGVYPPRFRGEYGPHMVQVFRDCCREAVRRGRVGSVVWLWFTALVDLSLTAVNEWFAGRPGPGHYVQKIGVGLAAGMAGGLAAGFGARLSMRGVALVGGLTPQFTIEGTLVILLVGLFLGAPLGVIYMALRRALPGEGVGKGLAYGLFFNVIFAVPTILFYREGELLLAPPLTGLALFAPLAIIYGGVLAWTVGALERGSSKPAGPALTAAPLKAAARQIGAVLLFGALLELGVLGIGSITSHVPSMPMDLVRALQAAHIPFSPVRNANVMAINLIALGYFGLSGLIFWQRTRSRLPRFAAIALFLFGGALFNTGAAYYSRLWIDQRVLVTAFHALQVMGCTALVALVYLFPSGRLAAPWLASLSLGWGGWALFWLLAAGLPVWLAVLVLVGFLSAGLAAQLRRYRAAPPEEQDQLRWPLRSFIVAVVGLVVIALIVVALPDLSLRKVPDLAVATTFGPYMLPWLFLPISIGYAMWRRGLWIRESPDAYSSVK